LCLPPGCRPKQEQLQVSGSRVDLKGDEPTSGILSASLVIASSEQMEDDMNDEYKGYRITAWPERDDTTGLWNGPSLLIASPLSTAAIA
jgi:hypothetical protein